MIRLGTNNLADYGLHIKKVEGLYDWPRLKKAGNVWPNRNYNEALNRLQDYQYEGKRITLDCYVKADSYADMTYKLSQIKAAIVYNGLRMLVLDQYSTQGYMVRLVKSTLFRPHRYFLSGKSVATFKLVFEEPQPFSVKLYWNFSSIPQDMVIVMSFTITKMSKGLSMGSLEQQYVTVNFNDETSAVNLEQESYTFNGSGMPHRLLPLVITGNIDAIEQISIGTSYPVQGTAEAAYFLRNELIMEI